jgi:hypothetical protein
LDWPIKTIVLKALPVVTQSDEDTGTFGEGNGMDGANESLSHVCGVLLNLLIEKNIAHNVFISADTHTEDASVIYILPRKYDLLIEDSRFFTSFNNLCGLIKLKDKETYQNIKFADYADFLSKNVSLSDDAFDTLKKDLVNKFSSEYEGQSFC